MKVTDETFQCEPSMVRMLAHAATDFSVYLPVCRAGVINRACVAVQSGVEKGAAKAIESMFGENVLRSAKIAGAEFYKTAEGKQVEKYYSGPSR